MATLGVLNITVATAATRVQVSTADLFVKELTVSGHAANTGHVYLGGVTVSSSVGLQIKVGTGPIRLTFGSIAGKSDLLNLKNVYVDVSVSGEKVSMLYIQ